MKTLLLSILLVLAWTSSGFAQQIYAQNFAARTRQIGFTITLTTSGPLEIIANGGPAPTLASTAETSVQIDGALPYLVDSSTLVYTTSFLPPGPHVVVVSASYSDGAYPTGAAIVIAPNEPGSTASDQSAIDTINTEITALQSQVNTDESNLAALQAEPSTTSIQAAEVQDAANISALQTAVSGFDAQLAAINNALQGEITAQANQISDLQTAESAGTSNIASIQSQIEALQSQLGKGETNQAADEATLASLQADLAAMQSQEQMDANQLANLQSQQAQAQAALGNLQTQINQDQSAQQAVNTRLENQIAALQGNSGNANEQNQINSVRKSNHLTRTLTYAGLGIGAAGLATALDVILSEDTSSGNPADHDPSSGTAADPKATTSRP